MVSFLKVFKIKGPRAELRWYFLRGWCLTLVRKKAKKLEIGEFSTTFTRIGPRSGDLKEGV